MVTLGVSTASEVKGLDIWITAVIDKTSFVAVEHTVETQREKFVKISLLD